MGIYISFVKHACKMAIALFSNHSAAKHYPCFTSYKYALLMDLDFNLINRSMQTLPKFSASASVRKENDS
ncbi:hypothetical protein [Tolypothrix sp. VBCCA 56010]|uniref:hypothetical protein n=1 Tax=Tolypothrix sp. VBCCA 56010 TaxID=3137731 RepID=UPI003D7CF896